MIKLAVLGNPIQHSLSPQVFSLFADQFKLNISYERILAIDNSDFTDTVARLFDHGYLALNVTSPFKQQAYQMAACHTSRSNFCAASNFMYKNTDNLITADTTDGIGFINDLIHNLNIHIDNLNILILGSGYVLDSILLDLIVCNPSSIDILARNTTRTNFLSDKFKTGVFNPHKNYDLIINTSPNVMTNMLFQQIVKVDNTILCYDLAYTSSLFHEHIQKLNHNIACSLGLGMLVEQAKVAFIKLFNLTPDTKQTLSLLSKR